MRKMFGKLKYKQKIYTGILVGALAIILFFIVTCINNLTKNAKTQTHKEAEYTAARVTSQIDERLENLWQFYSNLSTDEDVLWMLENRVKYSDYNEYHAAQEKMADSKIFGDYINEYALINFKTGWVLSNKGMYRTDETKNYDRIQQLYNYKNDAADKNYWYYDDSKEKPNVTSRDYRLTINTQGLDMIIKIANAVRGTEGMLLVNLDMQLWEKWICNMLDENEIALVLDGDGKIVYSSSQILNSETIVNLKDEFYKIGNEQYAVAREKSNVLGWNYYVYRRIPFNLFSSGSIITVFIAIALVSFICVIIGYLTFNPIRNLVKKIAGEEIALDIDEIDYLSDSFEGIKSKQVILQKKISENKRKIQELFELRLIRGEIKHKDEWDEYFKGLHIEECRMFATVVIILNLKDCVEMENSLNEDSMCISLLETLPIELDEMTWMPAVYNACSMFCVFEEKDEDALMKKISEFAEGFNRYSVEKIGYEVIFGISATHAKPYHIYEAYRESVSALTMSKNSKNSDDENKMRYYLNSMTTARRIRDFSMERKLVDAIKAVDREQCYHVIDDFSKELEEIGNMDEKIYLTTRVINVALEAATNAGLDLSVIYPGGVRKLYREICEVAENERVRRYLKSKVADPILKVRSDSLKSSTLSVMEKIEELIGERNGNITLAECTDEIGISGIDIWKILKMEKGVSFTELTEEHKLNKAKELLSETDWSVNRISDFLGYSNAQNFIRFFSRSTGFTPGKFRQLQ